MRQTSEEVLKKLESLLENRGVYILTEGGLMSPELIVIQAYDKEVRRELLGCLREAQKGMRLRWESLTDDDDNTYYEAESPYHDDGSPIHWRLRPRLIGDAIEWYEDHDDELMPDTGPDCWGDLTDAMRDIQEMDDNIRAEALDAEESDL